MKHLTHFPPALGRGLYYSILAVLGLLVLPEIAGLATLPVSTNAGWCLRDAPGRPLV